MKNKNYYSIHRNKKPKRRLQNTNWKSFYDVISKANELVKSLVELRNTTLRLSQPIPKYKQGQSGELAIIGNNEQPEIILDRDLPFRSNPFGNYKGSFGGITAEELTKNSNSFIEKIKNRNAIS
jgi:hypothetical protein